MKIPIHQIVFMKKMNKVIERLVLVLRRVEGVLLNLCRIIISFGNDYIFYFLIIKF